MALTPEIREKIDAWLEGGVDRSPAELARRAGVPYSTARRTLQGESTPTYNNLASILSVAVENIEVIPLLKLQFPEMTPLIDSVLSFKGREFSSQLAPRYHGLVPVITCFLCDSQGVDPSVIESEFGRSGNEVLKYLRGLDLIGDLPDGRVKYRFDQLTSFNVSEIVETLQSHVANTNRDNIENRRALVSFQWERVSRLGYTEILKLTEEYLGKTSHILQNNPGEIPAYVGAIANSHTDVQPANNGGLK